MIWQVSGGSRNRIILALTQQIILLLFYNINQHLLREYTMPDIVLSTFFILTHLTLTTTQELGTSIMLSASDEESEAPEREVTQGHRIRSGMTKIWSQMR